jgi:hypothetical protein
MNDRKKKIPSFSKSSASVLLVNEMSTTSSYFSISIVLRFILCYDVSYIKFVSYVNLINIIN